MNPLSNVLRAFSATTIRILDTAIAFSGYTPLDLSGSNPDLEHINIVDPIECQKYIDSVLSRNNAQVGYGGYLEKRNLYADKANFSDGAVRNVHLGIDFWSAAGTKVIAPLDGVVHSFQNNATVGDYGPTIILRHEIQNEVFYSLYGHLSVNSLDDLFVGKHFAKEDTLATLGTPDINVGYAPHLHFQFIHHMEGRTGDYPGVCSQNDLDFYTKNCPNPNLLLKTGL